MRIFIGVDLTAEPKREIEKLLKNLEKKHWKVEWETLEKLHLTLVFLGEISKEKLEMVERACRKVASELKPFIVFFKGLGCFPDFDFPRIIWIGLKGDLKSLAFIQKSLEKDLKDSGFDIKQRPFYPHLTLGRIKNARSRERREIGRQVKALREIDFKSQWLIEKIGLYESICFKEGSVYRKLKEASFSS